MPYTPRTWVDGTTPTSAANMNQIEQGIATAQNTAETRVMTLAQAVPGSRFAAPINGTLNTSATTARPSARTDIFFDWYSTVQPNNMIVGDTWDAPA